MRSRVTAVACALLECWTPRMETVQPATGAYWGHPPPHPRMESLEESALLDTTAPLVLCPKLIAPRAHSQRPLNSLRKANVPTVLMGLTARDQR